MFLIVIPFTKSSGDYRHDYRTACTLYVQSYVLIFSIIILTLSKNTKAS